MDKLDEISKILESELKYYVELCEQTYTLEKLNYYVGKVDALEWAIRVITLQRS